MKFLGRANYRYKKEIISYMRFKVELMLTADGHKGTYWGDVVIKKTVL